MSGIWSICGLTFRALYRSRFFYISGGIGGLIALGLPWISTGSETIEDAFRFQLGTAPLIFLIWISLAALSGGAALSAEMRRSGRLRLLLSLPISRTTLMLGQGLGVALGHLLLLGIVLFLFIGSLIPALARHHPNSSLQLNDFNGRTIHFFTAHDYSAEAEKIQKSITDSTVLNDEFLHRTAASLMLRDVEIPPDSFREWKFEKIPSLEGIHLRWRLFSGELSAKGKSFKAVRAHWTLNAGNGWIPLTIPDSTLLCARWTEQPLPSSLTGTVAVRLINHELDESLYLHLSEGPALLVPTGTFSENLLHASILPTAAVLLFSLIGTLLGALLSYPMALLGGGVYLFAGTLAWFRLSGIPAEVGFIPTQPYSDQMAQLCEKLFPALQAFDPGEKLQNGEWISWETLGSILMSQCLFRGLPFLLLLLFLWQFRKIQNGSSE